MTHQHEKSVRFLFQMIRHNNEEGCWEMGKEECAWKWIDVPCFLFEIKTGLNEFFKFHKSLSLSHRLSRCSKTGPPFPFKSKYKPYSYLRGIWRFNVPNSEPRYLKNSLDMNLKLTRSKFPPSPYYTSQGSWITTLTWVHIKLKVVNQVSK